MKFNLGDVVCVKNSFDFEMFCQPVYGRITTIHVEDTGTWYKIDTERRTFDEDELILLEENHFITYLEEERTKRHRLIDQVIEDELKRYKEYIKGGRIKKYDIDDPHL